MILAALSHHGRPVRLPASNFEEAYCRRPLRRTDVARHVPLGMLAGVEIAICCSMNRDFLMEISSAPPRRLGSTIAAIHGLKSGSR
jgi:hypothetical protein